MERALRSSFPRFAPWPRSTYLDSVRAVHAHDSIASVGSVMGDFDGDGRLDVAFDGVDTLIFPSGGRLAFPTIVAVFARGDSAVAVRVTEGALVAGDTLPTARSTWLTLVPRRSFSADIVNDAIGVLTVGDRELSPDQVYVWRGGRFLQWLAGE